MNYKIITLSLILLVTFFNANSQTIEITSLNWNSQNGLPYVQSFEANYSVDNFVKIDNQKIAFLSRATKSIIIYNTNSKSIENKINLNIFPIDFTFNNQYFYVCDQNNIYKINQRGSIVSQKSIKKIQFIENIKSINNKIYITDNNQNSYYFNDEKLENSYGIILKNNLFAKIVKQNRKSYKIIISNKSKTTTKTIKRTKHLGTVKIIGYSQNTIFIEEQTIKHEVPLKVKRQIIGLSLDDFTQTFKINVPDVAYTYVKHDNKIINNQLFSLITSPENAKLFSTNLNQENAKFPAYLYNINYHYNNHLLDISNLENAQSNYSTRATNATITRSQIIANGEPYATYSWYCNANNIKDYDCGGVHVTTPSWVTVGNNTSIPYCWGGFSSLPQFDTGISNGVSAGDSYTVGNGSGSSCAVGVDCSGFVSRCWDLPYKYGTSTLPNISTAYSSFDQLKRGDIVNYAGHHVRLVHTINSNTSFLIIEASGSGTNWRVGYNNYTTADLQSSYVPRWYDDVIDDPVDTIIPTTNISANNWETANFTTNFTDNDNISIDEQFYNVSFFNNNWKATSAKGFINDNFSIIDTNWINLAGNWNITNNTLNQSDETNSNTNIYAYVNQSNANSYLYHFKMKISGTGTNRRGGIYIMSDNPTLTQRNNSYMIYFRVDQDACQIYKSENDVIDLKTDDACTVNADTWFDVKIIFNKTSGKITVYKDNTIVSSWVDANPLTSGNYISFRTGECNLSYDALKVYKSRTSSATITLGTNNDVPFNNPSPTQPACLIYSLVTDSVGNFSNIDSVFVNIDTSIPSDVTINDGLYTDIDTFYTNTEISANWTAAIDTNSGIFEYSYCIGTSQGNDNIVSWTTNGTNINIDLTGISLTYDTTYYISVKSINNAGLVSNISTSNGQILKQTANTPIANFYYSDTNICVIDSIDFYNYSNYSTSSYWEFSGGSPATSTLTNPSVLFSAGTHTVKLIANGPGGNDTIIKTITVISHGLAIADFSVNDTLISLPNAYATFTNNSTNANNYEWHFGDGYITTDFSPWHLYSTAGYYTVYLIAKNNYCPNDTLTKNNYIHVTNSTNINNNTVNDFVIYPNPTKAYLQIKTNNLQINSYKIYNIYGESINNSHLLKNAKEICKINVTNLQKGIYFIKLQTNKGIIVKKFIKN